jgi:type I restriction-modification system DNA methylase subunit
MTQRLLLPFQNNNLFSNYFLTNQLLQSLEWSNSEYRDSFQQIKEVYQREKNLLRTFNEKQLEDHFFKPIFSILAHNYEVTERTRSQEFPDFAFFPDENARTNAHQFKNTRSFYANTIAIGEVKQIAIDLDRFGRDEYNRGRNPSLQLWMYLIDTEPKWGILSNGRFWRLYCKERRRDDFYEIDLISLIESDDIEGFRYFYYFFRKGAFLPSDAHEPFLERVLRGSADYAKEIGEDLKDNVYKAMKKVAEGFIEWRGNQLDLQNPESVELVHKNTMLLLYRILFLLYAEGKGLLDLNNLQYRENYSLQKLKNEIRQKNEGPAHQRYQSINTSLYTRLRDLFRLINQGSESFGIPRSEFYVPAYNGGLFDPSKHVHLERWAIGDSYLAEAIDLLSRGKTNGRSRDFIDYSTLEIRHLGSIYEGLLEYRLKVAEDDLVVKGDQWVTLGEYNSDRRTPSSLEDFNEFDRVVRGHIFLATDRGERKLTGSYYTPDFIVDYIVKHTLTPIINEKLREVDSGQATAKEALLSINILDPAMGSGHFLVGAVDFLAQKVLEGIQSDILAEKITDTSTYTSDWARREVVSRCIYGVDLNELAVELAKVSLWLSTISKDKPLSFLDHRLKQGNSLVGARLSDLRYYPGTAPEGSRNQTELPTSISPRFIGHLLSKMSELENLAEENLEDVKRKERIFEEFKQLPEYQRAKGLANVYTAVYFGNTPPSSERRTPAAYYQDLVWAIAGDDPEWQRKTQNSWFKKACDIGKKQSFLHWELEFPDVFFDGGQVKENPGWDAVIGNPPYIRQESLDPVFKDYAKEFFEGAAGTADIYVYFIEQSHKLLKKSGYFGVICSNKYMKANYGRKIRQYIKTKAKIIAIIDFGELPVFRDAATFPSVILTQKEITENQVFIYAAVKDLDFDTLDEEIAQIGIEQGNLSLEGNNWNFSTISEHAILEKIKRISENLGEFVGSEIYYGIKTGYNEAFIINRQIRDRLISQDPRNAEIIKSFVVGDDIRKYQVHFNDNYLIFTRRGIDINSYPSIKAYLEQFRERLEPKPADWAGGEWLGRKSGNYQWYEIQDAVDYYQEFEKPKILYPVIAKESRFAFDTAGFYINDKGFFIPRTDYYLLAILNSKVTWFILKRICSVLGDQESGGRLELRSVFLVNLPIRNVTEMTPPEQLTLLNDEAKSHYSSFIQGFDSGPILQFIDDRLNVEPQQSDVVRDLLAYLAEQMTTMNVTKNNEIQTLLQFIEEETGAHVDEMSNKTKIKEYYAYEFSVFIDILNRNKRLMREGYNPKSPQSYRLWKQWFDDSCNRLRPILARIDATDSLIDDIVYRLYGLTGEEITVIEGTSTHDD